MYTKSVHRSSHGADALGIPKRTLSFYECEAGDIPAGLAPPMARALGVSVDELLGETEKKRRAAVRPTGRMRRLFEAASKLPRSQKEKIAASLEAGVKRRSDRSLIEQSLKPGTITVLEPKHLFFP